MPFFTVSAMDNEYIIEMKNITKAFPGVIANNDVSLQIKKGEIFALLGENGAGKSTLMSMLFGMYEPDKGEIIIRGRKERILSPSYAAKLNIGMVHQHFKLVSNYTVTENIIMGMEPEGKLLGFLPYVDIKSAERQIAQLSEKYGLEVSPQAVISEISVSERQRVEILKMLYRDAEILIFDEPTAVLTPQEIDSLLKIIENLRDDGKTIILITHKLEEIKRIADRCAILRRGELVSVLDVKSTDAREMAGIMVGRQLEFETDKKKAGFGRDILEVSDLTVLNRDGFPVVKKASFRIREGEILAIAGVSGNGQVEIANAIAGLMKIESGDIILDGKSIKDLSIRERIEAGISYIPEDRQEVGLVLDFVLRDNLVLKQYYKNPFAEKGIRDGKQSDKYAYELIDKYDIRSARLTDTIVRSMSGGNQQKAIIGREIELNGKLTMFVQPTRGLDIGAIKLIHNHIIEERNNGKAVLLISLELDEVMDLADTIAVIYSGEIGRIAPAEELSEKEVGAYMMGVGGHKTEGDKV